MGQRTRTAATAHGEVEYQTVECDSCGSEVRKDDARMFVMMDDMKGTRSWHDHKEYEVYHGGYVEGWACPYCADSGPIDFPMKTRRKQVRDAWPSGVEGEILTILAMTLGFVLMAALIGAAM